MVFTDARRMTERSAEAAAAPADGSRLRAVFFGAAALEVGSLAALAWWPNLPFPWPGFGLLVLAIVGYAAAANAVRDGAASLTWIWIVGIAARLILMPVPPELTRDVWRYLWDGYIQLQGVNPYLYAPGAAVLEPLRTAWFDLVPNPGMHTLYPPLAQGAFVIAAWSGLQVLGLKLLWMVADLATAALMIRAARVHSRGRRLTLILYFWSPLLLVETAWNAHVQILGLLGLALALAWARRPVGAALGTAWSALVGLVPATAVPAVAIRLGFRYLAVALALFLVALLPYWAGISHLFDGANVFLDHTRFNGGIFALLDWVLPGTALPRLAATILFMLVVMWATSNRFPTSRGLLAVIGGALVLSPVLYPWHALWVLPMAVLNRRRSWLLLTCTSLLGYWGLPTAMDTGVWPQPLWARALIWVPPLLLLSLESASRIGVRLEERRESETTLA